jgi:hypothetical protein
LGREKEVRKITGTGTNYNAHDTLMMRVRSSRSVARGDEWSIRVDF